MSSLYLLWDESHLWGLIAWRALKSFGLSFQLVRGEDIAQGLLARNPPAVLVVPGGTARRKADRLGEKGMAAIRNYVQNGGYYLGFCGGAGLALSSDEGLGLCPWTRAGFDNRLLHMVSGHVRVSVDTGHALTPVHFPPQAHLPVWWPSRFAPQEGPEVDVLATCESPGQDFWLADLQLSNLPQGTLAGWKDLYGLELKSAHMAGSPCIITGECGLGRYVLSYAHLETPDSPEANQWLAYMLELLSGEAVRSNSTSPWQLSRLRQVWDDEDLEEAVKSMDEILALGLKNFLLFERTPWLYGWRAGIPGSSLNHLHGLLRQAGAQKPTPAAEEYWKGVSGEFTSLMKRFRKGVLGYLLAERLAMTLASSLPDLVSRQALKDQRESLFGPAMDQGGMYARLIDILEELVYRQLS